MILHRRTLIVLGAVLVVVLAGGTIVMRPKIAVATSSALSPEEEAALWLRVPKLRFDAWQANHGALGCGAGGMVLLLTSGGKIEVPGVGHDARKVFGGPIKVAELLALLRERCRFNRTREPGPMADQPEPQFEISSLGYVCLDAIAYSQDPEVIPVLAELLHDRNLDIRSYAGRALILLGKSSPELRAKVEPIEFPPGTAYVPKEEGVVPDWVRRAARK